MPSTKLLQVARGAAAAAFAVGLAVIIALTAVRAPLPWLGLLLVPGVPLLVAGQLLAIWEVGVARRSSGARGRVTFDEVAGPSRPSRNWSAVLLIAVLLTAIASIFIAQAGGHPIAPHEVCAYTTNDHGTTMCVSALQAASLQRFAASVVTGFFGLHAVAFDGGLAKRSDRFVSA